jgi:hypothetical protein
MITPFSRCADSGRSRDVALGCSFDRQTANMDLNGINPPIEEEKFITTDE